MLRKSIVNACAWGLRVYTKYAPFKRGRGLFIRAIEMLKRRGWPPPLTPIATGLAMEFEPSLLGWPLFERGEWEPVQTSILSGLMKPGMVVLDVGANTGYYVLLAASAVGTDGHVYAFEIQPEILEILRRNVRRNGLDERVTIVSRRLST